MELDMDFGDVPDVGVWGSGCYFTDMEVIQGKNAGLYERLDMSTDMVFVYPFFDPTLRATVYLANKRSDLSFWDIQSLEAPSSTQAFTKHNAINTNRTYVVVKADDQEGREAWDTHSKDPRWREKSCLTKWLFVDPFRPPYVVVSGWVCPPSSVKVDMDRKLLFAHAYGSMSVVLAMTLSRYANTSGDDCAVCAWEYEDMMQMLWIVQRGSEEDSQHWAVYLSV